LTEELGDLYLRLGRVAEATARYDAVNKSFLSAVARGSKNANNYNELAWFYVRKHLKPAEAVSLAERAVELTDSRRYKDTLGWAYLQNAQFEKALTVFSNLFSGQPYDTDGFASSWRGTLAIADAAIKPECYRAFLETMAQKDDWRTKLRTHIGWARFYAHNGETAKASAAWRQTGFPPETNWWTLGLFYTTETNAVDVVFSPEASPVNPTAESDKTKGRRRWQIRYDGYLDGFVDLDEIFGGNTDNATAYAWTRFTCAAECAAELRIGSDDQVKVWLNEKEAHVYPRPRLAVMDEDVVPVRLKTGENHLLVKICNRTRGYGFYLRITDPKGQPFLDFSKK
jgi:tetratricopeptide (TPR) repeat protein